MFIENSDAFKVWLTSVLEPLCDADPEALAKYVFALVKKDKPLEELRECMIEQLDVFLQSETKPFVELLFKTLDTQDYLNNSHVIPNTNPPNPNTTSTVVVKRDSPKADTLIVKEIKPIIPVSTLPNLSEAINGTVALKIKNDETISVGASLAPPTATAATTSSSASVSAGAATIGSLSNTSSVKRDRDVRKSDSEKDDVTRGGRGNRTSTRHRSSSRNRSRSRSWDRSGKRSRSRDRSPRMERRDRSRPWRNKSPPRRYDRDRRRSRSGSARIRSRSRSPRHSSYRIGGRYRNRSPPQRSVSRSRSRSRSRSNERTATSSIMQITRQEKMDKTKDDNSGGATPTQDSNHGDTDMRLINTTQSIQSVVSAGEGFKRRCRDFDEKGYCMRGEMCPYDHGVDPVVLEDTALSRVLSFGPNGAPAEGAPPPPPGAVAPGVVPPPGTMMNPQMPGGMLSVMPPGAGGFHPRGANMIEYNPSAPGMLYHHRPGFRPRGPPAPRGGMPPHHNNGGGGPFGQAIIQRELISVPVMDGPNNGGGGYKRRSEYSGGLHDASTGGGGPMKKRAGGFDFGRLGPRQGQAANMKNPANCSLELKKVPRGLNNITHLNNHFSKFGKIVNIQVCFEGDPEGAIVTFSSHAEANAAYRSTEAVLNNRFIKVFWHMAPGGGNSGENIPPPASMQQTNNGQQQQHQHQRGSAKERLGQPIGNKVLNLLQPKVTDENDEPQHQINNNNNINIFTAAAAGPGPATTTTTTTNKKSNVYVPSLVKKQQEQQKEDSKALANAAIVKNQEILAAKEQLKKKHEEKRKEALKITQDLRKRKQELLEKQLAQQKLLIEKLEKTNPSGQQRELLMSTIKTVQESIESIRKDMISQTVVPVSVPPPKSKEEAQREVLDAELDLITRQQEGGDTSELQRRLLELRTQAYNLTKASAAGAGGVGGLGPLAGGLSRRGRGGGSLRGARHHHLHHPHFHLMSKNNMSLDKRPNAAATNQAAITASAVAAAATSSTIANNSNNKKTVIDHRPTRLLVSGYEADEYESVVAHFSQYGEICEYVLDDSTPSIILAYRTRKEAEIAVLKGKHFQDRTLSITWCTDAQYTSVQRAANSKTVTLVASVPSEPSSQVSAIVAAGAAAINEQQQANATTMATIATTTTTSSSTAATTVATTAAAAATTVETDDDDDDDDNSVAPGTVKGGAGEDNNGDGTTLNTTEDQLLEGDDENISGEQLGTELSEEVLLQDDEEDLEEDEERSWRR